MQLIAEMRPVELKTHKNPFSAGAPPLTPLGELRTLCIDSQSDGEGIGSGYPLLLTSPPQRDLGVFAA